MNILCKTLVALAACAASGSMAYAAKAHVHTPEDMTCKEFIDMNPKAMTPVALWVLNQNTQYKGGDYVDWQEVDTLSVPRLINICKSKPESRLKQWINDIR